MGPCSPRQHPHFGLPILTPHRCQHASAGILGANPNLGRPTRGPSQGALHRNAGNWGPPSPSARLILSSGHHMSPSGPHSSFRWEKVQSSPSPCPPLKAPHAKSHWPMPLLPSTIYLACHSTHRTAFCSVLWASWVLTLTLVQCPMGRSQLAWHYNAGDWVSLIHSAVAPGQLRRSHRVPTWVRVSPQEARRPEQKAVW